LRQKKMNELKLKRARNQTLDPLGGKN
jgi:hypothetical protein